MLAMKMQTILDEASTLTYTDMAVQNFINFSGLY